MTNNQPLPVSTQAREAADAKIEYDRFCTWARTWFPGTEPPSASSHMFAAWMARARFEATLTAQAAEADNLTRKELLQNELFQRVMSGFDFSDVLSVEEIRDNVAEEIKAWLTENRLSTPKASTPADALWPKSGGISLSDMEAEMRAGDTPADLQERKAVSREPSAEMIARGLEEGFEDYAAGHSLVRDVWRTMWDAAPADLQEPARSERDEVLTQVAKGVETVMGWLPEHAKAWREAIIIARDHNDEADDPDMERAAWNQHLKEFDWLFATVLGQKRKAR